MAVMDERTRLRVVSGADRAGPPSLPAFSHQTPEIASLRALARGLDDSAESAGKMVDAGQILIRAASAIAPSKSIESVSAWLAAHEDALEERRDPYPRAGDLREAVHAAADELDAATGRRAPLWHSTYVLAAEKLGRDRGSYEILGGSGNESWWTRRVLGPIPGWGVVAIAGAAAGFLAGILWSRRRESP